MNINIPFLTAEDNDVSITDEMELASAFLYFEANRSESLKSLFSKSSKEKISSIVRGIYPLRAKFLLQEDKLYGIFDENGLMGGNAEIGCKPRAEVEMDIDSVSGLDIKGKINVFKEMINTLKKGGKTPLEIGNFIWGYENLREVFERRDYGALNEISIVFNSEEKQEGDGSEILRIIGEIGESVEKEIGILKDLCELDDDNFKNSFAERNKIYDEFKDKIYQTDREVSNNIGALIVEREGKIREIEKIYSDKCAYLAQDFIFNKNKHDIAKIYGNETEMDIYKRSMSDAEEKIEKYKKEAGEEIKKLEKHYDMLLEDEKKKIKQAISDRDKRVRECEDLYTQAHSTIDELKNILSSDIFARRSELEKIRGWMCKFDMAEEELEYINIPFYMALYGEGNSKVKVFVPAALEDKNKILSLISGIAGKISLPFGERHKIFDDFSKRIKEYLKEDKNNYLINMLPGSNLIAMEGIGEKVELGLKSLLDGGYINDKNYEKSSTSIKTIFSGE